MKKQRPTIVHIEPEPWSIGEEVNWLGTNYHLASLREASPDTLTLLKVITPDLIVINPIPLMNKVHTGVPFVHELREPTSASRETPIIAYSVLSNPRIINYLREQGVEVINSLEETSERFYEAVKAALRR